MMAQASRWTRERRLRVLAIGLACLFLFGLFAAVLGGGQ